MYEYIPIKIYSHMKIFTAHRQRKTHTLTHPVPILFHTVAGSCPDIRCASEKEAESIWWGVLQGGNRMQFSDGHRNRVHRSDSQSTDAWTSEQMHHRGESVGEGMFTITAALLLWSCRSQAANIRDLWAQCPYKVCKDKFADGFCDKECFKPECLQDGFDCLTGQKSCESGYTAYCRRFSANSHCEQGCNTGPCGWDGSDCVRDHSYRWAKGTLIIHAEIPPKQVSEQNTSFLWDLSSILQSTLMLRGIAPFDSSQQLFALDPQELADLLNKEPPPNCNGSLLFLQVDNRPCSQFPPTCFPFAAQAANFLRAMKASNHLSHARQVLEVRGVSEELGYREEDRGPPSWLWAVVGVATCLALALALLGVLVARRMRRRRRGRRGGERAKSVSTVTDQSHHSPSWTLHTPHRGERVRRGKEKERNSPKKKKKGKEAGKRRSEPLGEDAIRLRPLKKDLDIGSDTDITQSSMEDVSTKRSHNSIHDHRPQEQKNLRVANSSIQSPSQGASRGWERAPNPAQSRTFSNSTPVQWCGPDGSVVLIRAVRSGLDRVVLELLRAGVPVNNTDHTGRSALHWACSVNHLILARTLIRYGAAVDLQDYKGETALFLSALHGCYDTARFLLLHGANQDLSDWSGRCPIDVAREGLHQQVVELLLAHRPQKTATQMPPDNDMSWNDHAVPHNQWTASPGLPGRSASFSGVIGYRQPPVQHPSNCSMSRGRCASPQQWRPPSNQSATALVSPRVLGGPSRLISTLPEVTSEEEDGDREQEVTRAITPHFPHSQYAARQRSFSCTQHTLQRRSSNNQLENSLAPMPVKTANECTEKVIPVTGTEASRLPDATMGADLSAKAKPDRETGNGQSCNQKVHHDKMNSSRASESETPAQTVL
ncbi:uncharacterized protein notchl isoform X2 [Paramormyrops kingsleyae]|uniref:uncharacterized protein notchl isoform X2 n=1 Tax=Paramormyrops kingsleyae TaxID=1676925 RepID=UPI003B9763E1